MQLPRVLIAAVFFVIGLLIALPWLSDVTGITRSSAPVGSTSSPAPGDSGSPSPSPSGTRTGRGEASPSPSRSASPSPSRAAAPAHAPLVVTFGAVDCPARTVDVTVRNTGKGTEDYAIERNDGSAAVAGRLAPGASRTTVLTLREDRRTRVEVTWRNRPVRKRTITADCRRAAPEPSPTDKLPHTGSDSAVLWARAATGTAAMLTGAIIFWYGGIWPRRREQIFAKKTGGE
ncbi:MAG: hypothetical protein IRY90_05955 [Actinomadura rubrobrunea]|nr:hypothetical protein [Actinomadura rubrobrunea]